MPHRTYLTFKIVLKKSLSSTTLKKMEAVNVIEPKEKKKKLFVF